MLDKTVMCLGGEGGYVKVNGTPAASITPMTEPKWLMAHSDARCGHFN